LSDRAKIEPRRKTGTCAAHQRSLNVALKRARQLALLPFTAEHIRITGMLLREPGTPPWRGTRGPRPVEAPAEVVAVAPDGAASGPDTAPNGSVVAPDGAAAEAVQTPAPAPTEAPVAATATAETPAAAVASEA
jgi:hypothetical protein